MYIKRTVEEQIKKVNDYYPVLVLRGPRQVGKSTILLKIKPSNMKYVTLDDLNIRSLALSDPEYFLKQYGTP